MVYSKLQEVIMKNIWEIENNPAFNVSGGGGFQASSPKDLERIHQQASYHNTHTKELSEEPN
jgi:hypothetical protein